MVVTFCLSSKFFNSGYIGSLDKYLYCLFNLVTFFVLFFLRGPIDEKAAQLHAITSLQAMLGKQQGSFVCIRTMYLQMTLNVSPTWPAGRRYRVTRRPKKSTGAMEQACFLSLVTLGPLINTCTVFSILLHFCCFF